MAESIGVASGNQPPPQSKCDSVAIKDFKTTLSCMFLCCCFFFLVILVLTSLKFYRGGVKDTRLEAKAKDTKKNLRPRTAFPRTDHYETKDRNARGQGPTTQPQVFFKKKTKFFKKKFFRRSPAHRRSQNFRLGGPKPQITCNDVIKNFQKRNFLWNKDIVEWKI